MGWGGVGLRGVRHTLGWLREKREMKCKTRQDACRLGRAGDRPSRRKEEVLLSREHWALHLAWPIPGG